MAGFLTDHSNALAALSEWAIEQSVEALKAEDRLTVALRESLQSGADINDLSGVTGIPVPEIQRRTNGNLNVLDDLALLA